MDNTLPKNKSWFERNIKWILPLGCLSVIFLIVGFIASIFILVMGFLKNSDVYKEALGKAQIHPVIIEKIGEPIEEGWYFMGNISVNGSSGQADIMFPISGPKGEATVYVVGQKTAGRWSYSIMEVELDSTKERVRLIE